jgi:hypothetical protein
MARQQDAKTPTLVNVKAKSYRHVALYEPGEWKAVLKYNHSRFEPTLSLRLL